MRSIRSIVFALLLMVALSLTALAADGDGNIPTPGVSATPPATSADGNIPTPGVADMTLTESLVTDLLALLGCLVP